MIVNQINKTSAYAIVLQRPSITERFELQPAGRLNCLFRGESDIILLTSDLRLCRHLSEYFLPRIKEGSDFHTVDFDLGTKLSQHPYS